MEPAEEKSLTMKELFPNLYRDIKVAPRVPNLPQEQVKLAVSEFIDRVIVPTPDPKIEEFKKEFSTGYNTPDDIHARSVYPTITSPPPESSNYYTLVEDSEEMRESSTDDCMDFLICCFICCSTRLN